MHSPSSYNLQQLEYHATQALTSLSPEERDTALDSLRYLSTYDYWETVKKILLETTNTYLIVVLSKAMRFMVANEIGPIERDETLDYILNYVAQKVWLPRYIVSILFSIFAVALHLNWRIRSLTSSPSWWALPIADVEAESSNLGREVEAKLSDILPRRELVLSCIKEILVHFAAECASDGFGNGSTHVNFWSDSLPQFFGIALENVALEDSGLLCALEMCDICLNFPTPRSYAPLVSVTTSTEESVYLHPAVIWTPILEKCAFYCSNLLSKSFTEAGAEGLLISRASALRVEQLCFCLLSSLSCVVVGDSNCGTSSTGNFREEQVPESSLCTTLLQSAVWLVDYYRPTKNVEALHVGTRVLLNLMERHHHVVAAYFAENLSRVEDLKAVFVSLVTLSDPPAEKVLFHYSQQEAIQTTKKTLLQLFSGIANVAETIAAGHMNSTDAVSHVMDCSKMVFNTYLRSAVEFAHLQEDSSELRSDVGPMLHCEQHLQPLVPYFFSHALRGHAVDQLCTYFNVCHEAFLACSKLRRSESLSQEEVHMVMELCVSAFLPFDDADDIPLVASTLVLSRMSTIVSLVALSLNFQLNYCHEDLMLTDDNSAMGRLITNVCQFARSLVSEDSDITDLLLSCLCVADSSSKKFKKGNLHVGVLRSLVYFCEMASLTPLLTRPAFWDLLLDILFYIFCKHGDCFALVSDATRMLWRIVCHERIGGIVLHDKMGRLLKAHLRGDILVTASQNESNSQMKLLRSEALRTFTSVAEAWALHFPQQPSVVREFILLALLPLECGGSSVELAACFDDLESIANGCSFLHSTVELLEILTEFAPDFLERIAECATVARPLSRYVHLLAVFCDRSMRKVPRDLRSHVYAKFLSGTFAALLELLRCMLSTARGTAAYVFGSISKFPQANDLSPSARLKENFMNVHQCSDVDGAVCEALFDISIVLESLTSAKWCNLGILFHYEAETAEAVLVGCMSLLLSVPPSLVMSSGQTSHCIFAAIHSVIVLRYPSDVDTEGGSPKKLWPELARFLTKCLACSYIPVVAECLLHILRVVSPTVMEPEVYTLVAHEAATTLATVALDADGLERCCLLLYESNIRAAVEVHRALDELLKCASAYHRVRIRCLLMLLDSVDLSSHQSLSTQYLSIFGNSGTKLHSIAPF